MNSCIFLYYFMRNEIDDIRCETGNYRFVSFISNMNRKYELWWAKVFAVRCTGDRPFVLGNRSSRKIYFFLPIMWGTIPDGAAICSPVADLSSKARFVRAYFTIGPGIKSYGVTRCFSRRRGERKFPARDERFEDAVRHDSHHWWLLSDAWRDDTGRCASYRIGDGDSSQMPARAMLWLAFFRWCLSALRPEEIAHLGGYLLLLRPSWRAARTIKAHVWIRQGSNLTGEITESGYGKRGSFQYSKQNTY